MTIKKFGLTYTKEKNAETCSKVDHIHEFFPVKIPVYIIQLHGAVNWGKKVMYKRKNIENINLYFSIFIYLISLLD
jgi:hypothetical protein